MPNSSLWNYLHLSKLRAFRIGCAIWIAYLRPYCPVSKPLLRVACGTAQILGRGDQLENGPPSPRAPAAIVPEGAVSPTDLAKSYPTPPARHRWLRIRAASWPGTLDPLTPRPQRPPITIQPRFRP